MKSLFSVLALAGVLATAACSSNGGGSDDSQAKVTAVSECPVLAGYYESGNRTMTITESRSADAYRVRLGEEANEMIIDGQQHVISGKAFYLGTCQNGVLEIFGQDGERIARLRVYFNSEGQMVQEYAGEFNSTSVWDKK